MHWQSTSSTSFKITVNFRFWVHTSAFCSSQWGVLLWLRWVFYFQRAKLFKVRLYHHLLVFARLFIPDGALSFGGFSFVSSRKSHKNTSMAFCPCPEPCTLEILLLFLSFWLGMWRNRAPSFTTWSWFFSFAQEISQQILAQGWQGCLSFWIYFEQSRNPYLKSVIYVAHTINVLAWI